MASGMESQPASHVDRFIEERSERTRLSCVSGTGTMEIGARSQRKEEPADLAARGNATRQGWLFLSFLKNNARQN